MAQLRYERTAISESEVEEKKTLPTLNPSEPRNSHVATYVATYPEFHAPVSELEPESGAELKTEPETEIGAETRQKEIPRPGAKQSQRQ